MELDGINKAHFWGRLATSTTCTIVLKLLGIITGMLVARALGPAGRGQLAALLYLPGLLLPIAGCGIPQAVALLIIKVRREAERALMTGFFVSLVLGIILSLLACWVAPLFLPIAYSGLISSARLVTLYIPAALCTAVLIMEDLVVGRLLRYYAYQIAPVALYAAGIVGLWATGAASPPACALACAGAQLATAAARIAQHWKALRLPQLQPALASKLLRVGFPLHLPTVFGIFLQRLDILIMLWIATPAQVGIYATAVAVGSGQLGLTASFAQLTFVDFVDGEGQPPLRAHLHAAQLLVVTSCIVSLFLGPAILKLGFGPAFGSALSLIVPLTLLAALRNVTEVLGQMMRAIQLVRALILASAIETALAVALGTAATKVAGPLGLVFALLVCEIAMVAYLAHRCCQREGLSPMEVLLTPQAIRHWIYSLTDHWRSRRRSLRVRRSPLRHRTAAESPHRDPIVPGVGSIGENND